MAANIMCIKTRSSHTNSGSDSSTRRTTMQIFFCTKSDIFEWSLCHWCCLPFAFQLHYIYTCNFHSVHRPFIFAPRFSHLISPAHNSAQRPLLFELFTEIKIFPSWVKRVRIIAVMTVIIFITILKSFGAWTFLPFSQSESLQWQLHLAWCSWNMYCCAGYANKWNGIRVESRQISQQKHDINLVWWQKRFFSSNPLHSLDEMNEKMFDMHSLIPVTFTE